MPKKLVGLRLSEDNIQKLDIIAHNNNQSINSVAKNAIIEYLEIFSRIRQQGMIVLGKPLIKELIESVDVVLLQTLAEMTAKRKVNFFHFILGNHLSRDTLKDFIKYTPKLFGNTGLMWFEHIEIIRGEKSIFFKCIHDLGEKWSRFSIYFFSYLLKMYLNMDLNKNNVKYTKNSLYLEYMF